MKVFSRLQILALISASLVAWTAHAQFDGDNKGGDAAESEEGSGEVEALYDKMDKDQAEKKAEQNKAAAAKKAEPPKDVTTLSDLSGLAPFEDIAVIQRRFLPRTHRFEVSASGMTLVNNPFFNNMGLGLRADFFITEKHGIEAQGLLFSNSRRDVTTNLENKQNVRTTNLVTPKHYMGLAYKWTPIYGKITFLNSKIVPFDLSFTVGGGLSQTDKKGEPTIHFGTGQTFAMSKGFALRWDFLWNFYQAEADAASGVGTTTSSHSDLFLSAGVSFFFPEATYR